MDKKREKPILRSILIGLAIILGVVVYAYGFKITDVNFETTRDQERLFQLRRIIRALAQPNVFDYEQESIIIDTTIYLPCPEGGVPEEAIDTSGPYLVLDPACGNAEEIIQVRGYNLWPNAKGTIIFVAAPSGAERSLAVLTTDNDGDFTARVALPNRAGVADPQKIKAELYRNIGAPYLSDTALSTWEKILETVFLALIATTFGTLLAIPISFLAARNLMSEEKSLISSMALSLVGWPIGLLAGIWLSDYFSAWLAYMSQFQTTLVVGLIAFPLLAWLLARWALPRAELDPPPLRVKLVRWGALFVAGIFGIYGIFIFKELALNFGKVISLQPGFLSFMGNFIFQLGDLLNILLPGIVALMCGAILGGFGSRLGVFITNNGSDPVKKIFSMVLGSVAGAEILAVIGAIIDWFYQIDNLTTTLYWPAGIGAVIGLVGAIFLSPDIELPTGLVSYYVVRTLLNATRSVEPLVMVIVFVVWVGIGPFAGALALGLHTIAALAKLFSEQVESILPGPLEAIKATGANRLQTIVYAVVPQIIPPYISFTMYRWDINVRMSTIIGFGGGGGIGFLLSQNIRLLNYKDASVQMLAIAITVASMDYISSVLRERFV